VGFVEGHDRSELVIKDNMILRRDVACFQVEDQRAQRGVLGREPNKHSFPSTGGPFRDTFSILKVRVQNVDRTAKNMCSLEIRVIGA
jgi:hypothetical protein